MRTVMGIDPGTNESAWVIYSYQEGQPDGGEILDHGHTPNQEMLGVLSDFTGDKVALEMVGHYNTGMSVGSEVFQTCVWIGRFWQQVHQAVTVEIILRTPIKLELCGTAKAKDPNIVQALKDILGAPGTAKSPGPTYGITKHKWQALAVALCCARGIGHETFPLTKRQLERKNKSAE